MTTFHDNLATGNEYAARVSENFQARRWKVIRLDFTPAGHAGGPHLLGGGDPVHPDLLIGKDGIVFAVEVKNKPSGPTYTQTTESWEFGCDRFDDYGDWQAAFGIPVWIWVRTPKGEYVRDLDNLRPRPPLGGAHGNGATHYLPCEQFSDTPYATLEQAQKARAAARKRRGR